MSPHIDEITETKFRAGRVMIRGTLCLLEGGMLEVSFKYNKTLVGEFKSMEGARWNPTKKRWLVKDSPRNRFQLDWLQGGNPYARYDLPLVDYLTERPLMSHQIEMTRFGLTRHYCILAAEMGCLHADTPLRCEKSDEIRSVAAWHVSGRVPTLKCYDIAGNIQQREPSRIFTKRTRLVRVWLDGHAVTVGEDHVFLNGGRLCKASSLRTGSTIGILATSTLLTRSRKPTGTATATVMEATTSRMYTSDPSSPRTTRASSPGSSTTSSTPPTTAVGRSSSLGSISSRSVPNTQESSRRSHDRWSDTSCGDSSTPTDQFRSGMIISVSVPSTRLSVTPASVFSTSSPVNWAVASFPDTVRTRFQSTVEAEFKTSETIYTETPLVTWNERSFAFERLGTILTAAESDHFVPVDFRNFRECEVTAVEFLGEDTVYDLTMPGFGNYFDANGVSHQNTGKTLSAIEIMEASGFRDWFYVAPKSALRSVEIELEKWKCKVRPRLITYEGLKAIIQRWAPGAKAPHGVIFDESSRLKNPTAQRTRAALELANGIRNDWGDDGYVILMSGTPAPKSPVDWWSTCFSRDTWVLTSQGPRQIYDLNDQRHTFVYHGAMKYAAPLGSFLTGRKPLFEVVTREGYKLKVTDGQRLAVDYNGIAMWQELGKLRPGDRLYIHHHRGVSWGDYGSYDQGYLVGHVIGDGNVSTTDGKDYGYLRFFPDDYGVIPYVLGILGEDHRCEPDITDGHITICSKTVHALCREFGLDRKKEINSLIEGSSSDFLCGLVSGFFDTDGDVEQGRLRVSLGQSDLPRLEAVQRILLYLGIPCRIYPKPPKDSVICSRPARSGPRWVLTISGEHVRTFHDRIGFNMPRKAQTLKEQLGIRSQMSQPFLAEIVAINPCGTEEVWDITVPDVQAFAANGFVAHNCEIARPGFLKEGSIEKCKSRLGLIVQKENIQGGVYPQLITWRDDARKCAVCGQLESYPGHDPISMVTGEHGEYHAYVQGTNEVEMLYKRMQGLVMVKFKKDVLDLPLKRYEIIRLKPSPATLRAASIITARAKTVISAMTLLRELSDGFQYSDEESGTTMCKLCRGACTIVAPVLIDNPDPWGDEEQVFEAQTINCPNCGGSGETIVYTREALKVDCPKVDAVKELLDVYDDVGRTVFYAGFGGSVDRVVETCLEERWEVIRVDGRGPWWASWGKVRELDMLKTFQTGTTDEHPRIAFVGQPSAAGMGLTLTASPMICYWSNDFNAESRIQSEDRAHRMGMDINRGCTIYDLVHLPTDEKVLLNLQGKRALQAMSMGEIDSVFKNFDPNAVRSY